MADTPASTAIPTASSTSDATSAAHGKRERDRIRPLEALRALRALSQNPDDTSQVFRILRALPSGNRIYRRFRKTEAGARMLADRPQLLATLQDREALLAMPPGSLGRRYAEFMDTEQISADGLVAASIDGGDRGGIDADEAYVGERMRDMHDLWHVVTGYSRDLLGEAALLAFTFAQTRTPGIGVIVGHALWVARGDFAPARPIIWRGFRRGLGAEWLPAQEWEKLLPLPLAEVRERLRVGEPPAYTQLRSEGAPAAA